MTNLRLFSLFCARLILNYVDKLYFNISVGSLGR